MRRREWKFRLQPKLLLGLVVMAVVLLLSLTIVVVTLYRSQMEELYGNIAFNEAEIAAQVIDGDSILRYYSTGQKDQYYEEIHSYLLLVKQKMGLNYFYVVVPEEDMMVYIWDSGTEGEDGVCDLLDTDEYYGGGYALMHNALSVNPERNILVTQNAAYG